MCRCGGDDLVDWIGDGVEEVDGFEAKDQAGDGEGDECPDFAAAQIGWKFFVGVVVFGLAEWAEADFADHDEEVHRGDDHACACKDTEPWAQCGAPGAGFAGGGPCGVGLE